MPQLRAAAQPTTVGHYTLIERVGTGGQGEVWRAHDESRGVDIGLKILAPSAARNPEAWDALEREHAISTRLQHPGILQVLPPERFDDVVVLPMELAAGGDLRRLRGAGYLEIVPVLLEAAEALEYAHARGVVHRDLKPGNVLFDSRGRVKLADFGIAALLPAAGAGAAESRGAGHSPFSASPEQLRGEPPSAADDIYGLGALAYELLSGHPPYYPNFDLKRALTQPVPQLVPTRQIPPELGQIVMRMLAKSAADRPATMQQVMDELDATLNATLSFAPEGAQAGDDDDLEPEEIAASDREAFGSRSAETAAAGKVERAAGQGIQTAADGRARAPADAKGIDYERVGKGLAQQAGAMPVAVDIEDRRQRSEPDPPATPPRPTPTQPGSAAGVVGPDAASPARNGPVTRRPPLAQPQSPDDTQQSARAAPQSQDGGRQPARAPSQSQDGAHQPARGSSQPQDGIKQPARGPSQPQVGARHPIHASPPARHSAQPPMHAPQRPQRGAALPAYASPQAQHRAQHPIYSFFQHPGEFFHHSGEAVAVDDPFDLDDGHPRLRATPPPGRYQASARHGSGGGRAARWPYLLSGILCGAVLICGAAAAALHWLPREDIAGLQALLANIAAVAAPQSATPPTASANKPPAPVAHSPAPKPPVDPAALARLYGERADFDKRVTALEERGAAAWDAADFSAAQMQAAEANGAAAAGGIAIALQHLNQAEQLLAGVATKAPQALAVELKAGDAALAAGHQDVASQAYALARRIDPNSQRAVEGVRRAHLLSGVLPLLGDARRAESAHDYSRAAQDFSQALALDPGNPVAKEGLARANAAFGDDNYARSVGAGFAALGAGRLSEAQTDFQQALNFRPQGTEATEGLQRVSAAMQASRIASLRQQAAALEAQEHWRQAEAIYDTALQVDPSLAFAKHGKAHAEARAQLSGSLEQIIDHPDRLVFPAVRDEAVALLQEAREQTPEGPVLQSQVEQLAQLLPQLDRPVLLNLISDNSTQVTIPSIGVFGTFGRREIRLKPGTYTVIGTRDGYRAVHQEFTVEPGQQSVTITVSCSEPI